MKFKTFIVSLGAVFFLFNAADAGIVVGLDFKGGLNVANMYGDDVSDDVSIKLGAAVGTGVGIKIGMFAIQPEVLFSMKGAKEEGEIVIVDSTFNYEIVVKLSYLEIPILLKINIPADAVIPNFYVGPALAFCMVAKDKLTFNNEEGDEEDIKDVIKSVDFGLSMGGGLDIKAGHGRVIIDIRYTLGFVTVNDQEDEDIVVKNSVLSFILGYGIDFDGK